MGDKQEDSKSRNLLLLSASCVLGNEGPDMYMGGSSSKLQAEGSTAHILKVLFLYPQLTEFLTWNMLVKQ